MKFISHPLFVLPVFIIFGLVSFYSCTKDELSTDPSYQLTFSNDSIIFDTVFTTIGSVTQELRIYNKNNEKIKISSIRLAGAEKSAYSLNIDGHNTWIKNNVELEKEDSLYIFVRVRINPNDKNSPFLVSDSIEFLTNGNYQYVKLIAYGQNAYYHTPKYFPADEPAYSIIDCSHPWTNDKPHLIYGWAIVDSASTLVIEAGTRVYFHYGARLLVKNGGNLQVNGEAENKVIFRNDRLDPFYKDLSGQWEGIYIADGNGENFIHHAEILNATTGIRIGQNKSSEGTPFVITDTRIGNMKIGGLWANDCQLYSVNCAIENCGSYAIQLEGGTYEFIHLSIGNFWSSSIRTSPSLLLSDYYLDGENQINIEATSFKFTNCIIYGNQYDEIYLDKGNQNSEYSYFFDHCLLKTTLNTADENIFSSCLINIDPLFKDIEKLQLELDSLSPALHSGKAVGVMQDILGRQRNMQYPALGAYEPNY